jgi:hypothetical protein
MTYETGAATPPLEGMLQLLTLLCEKCKQPFDCWPPKDRFKLHFRWYDTVAEVHVSAKNGCGLCTQLLKNGKFLRPSDAPDESDSNVGALEIHSLSDGTGPEEGMLFYTNMFWYADPVAKENMERHVWAARAILIPHVQ